MLNKVISAIEKYEMFKYNTDVTVALSGGADSVCLLHVLFSLKEKYSLTLSAIHVNHMLRGEESDRDEAFAKALCERFNIPITVKRADVNALAKETGESTELAARNIRYKLFKETASGLVATAHTASDNLETVLFNMVRGSGLKGMTGIPPKREIFVRPLIFCTREDIENYLSEQGLNYVTDSTNLTDDYTRNFLRHTAVPALKKVNPSAEQRTAQMCRSLREDEEFLSEMAMKIYNLCLKNGCLDAELLGIQHPAIIKRVIAIYLFEQFGLTLDSLHIENCLKIASSSGKTGLWGGFSALCEKGRFFVLKDDEKEDEISFLVETEEINLKSEQKINNLLLKNAIDCGKINGSLTLRSRLPSDSIRLKGRNCTKTLKKLFSEKKIPLNMRDSLPVACDDSGVVWVYKLGVSERVAVDGNTEKAKLLKVKEINKTQNTGDVKYDK